MTRHQAAAHVSRHRPRLSAEARVLLACAVAFAVIYASVVVVALVETVR